MGRPINKRYLGPQVGGSYTITGYGSFAGGAAEECYIVRQRSVERFEVARASDDQKMIAFLTDDTSPAEGYFYVQVDKQNGDPIEYARKITNRRVYTHNGGSYDLVIGEVASNDADTANVEGLGGMGVSDVAVSAADSTITANPTTGVASDGVATSTITVQAKDSDGNNLNEGGETVALSTDSGTASLTAVVDNSDGTYTANLSNTVAETVTVSGTINGDTIGDNATVTFV